MSGPTTRCRRPADPGLQLERTVLAWRRTLLATVVLIALTCRLMIPISARGTAVLAAVGAAVLAYGATALPRLIRRLYAGFAAVECRRAGARDDPTAPRSLPGAGSALVLALLVAASGLLGTAALMLRIS
mgnify:CR=1 FL=1